MGECRSNGVGRGAARPGDHPGARTTVVGRRPCWPWLRDRGPAGWYAHLEDIRRLAAEAATQTDSRWRRMGRRLHRCPPRGIKGLDHRRRRHRGPRRVGGLNGALLVRRIDGRPDLLPAAGASGRVGGLRRHGGTRQHLLSARVRLDLPVLARPHARVPRRQAVHRAVLAHPGHGRRHLQDPLHHVRAQAPHAASTFGGQAGDVGGRDDRQPTGPRGGHQPLARGLRAVRRALGGSRSSDGRGGRHRAGPLSWRLLRVPRRGVRPPADQDHSHAELAAAHPGGRSRHARTAPCSPFRRLAPRRGRPGRPSRPPRDVSARSGKRRAPPTGNSRST